MTTTSQNNLFRSLPQVEEVLNNPTINELTNQLPREIIVDCVRHSIESTRQSILLNNIEKVDVEVIVANVLQRVNALEQPSLRRVINATGIIIHTNLGRSALAQTAIDAVVEVAQGYSTLEYDPSTRTRGSRHDHCEQLICTLTGAEAAIAVNNNAAAVMMVLSEFSAGQEAIISRGELIEIGGSFRIPDIMDFSHAHMVEVGTTNKTRRTDYARALTQNTALLLKVHPSNFSMQGFTQNVGIDELRILADQENEHRSKDSFGIASREHNADMPASNHVLVYEDQGSGVLSHFDCLADTTEPTVAESLQQGCDLVSFSGDKLLGGPQAGIIVGKKKHIDRLKKNPLARVLRLDKMTLAALEATLRLYLDKERALKEIPTLRMLSAPASEVRTQANVLLDALNNSIPAGNTELSVIPEISRAGGGALPLYDIDTFAVVIRFLQGSAPNCEQYLASQRTTPIIARVKKDSILCDARTILNKGEIDEIALAFKEYFESLSSSTKGIC